MQIYEITKNRINEATLGGFAQGAGKVAAAPLAAGAGIVKGLAQNFINQTLPGAQDPNAMVGPGVSRAGAQGAAAKVNAPLVKILATTLLKAWNQSLPTAMARAGVTEPGAIDKPQLKELLLAQVKQLLKQDYTAVNVDPSSAGGEGQELAQTAKDTISSAVERIATYPQPGTGKAKTQQQMAAEFSSLAQGVSALQNIIQFQGTAKTANQFHYQNDDPTKPMVGNEAFNNTNPQHQAAFAQHQAQMKAANVA